MPSAAMFLLAGRGCGPHRVRVRPQGEEAAKWPPKGHWAFATGAHGLGAQSSGQSKGWKWGAVGRGSPEGQ